MDTERDQLSESSEAMGLQLEGTSESSCWVPLQGA